MADDKSQRGGQDRTKIDVNQDYELQGWARKFGVSTDQLKQAVEAVGPKAADVQAHLQSGGRAAR